MHVHCDIWSMFIVISGACSNLQLLNNMIFILNVMTTSSVSEMGIHFELLNRVVFILDYIWMEKKLLSDLMPHYDRSARPVLNISNQVLVRLSLTLTQIVNVVSKTYLY